MRTTINKKGVEQYRRESGQFSMKGDLTRVCKCGKLLADHMAGFPHEYISQEGPMSGHITCPKFRQEKKSKKKAAE
jgi:hypothetical protein